LHRLVGSFLNYRAIILCSDRLCIFFFIVFFITCLFLFHHVQHGFHNYGGNVLVQSLSFMQSVRSCSGDSLHCRKKPLGLVNWVLETFLHSFLMVYPLPFSYFMFFLWLRRTNWYMNLDFSIEHVESVLVCMKTSGS